MYFRKLFIQILKYDFAIKIKFISSKTFSSLMMLDMVFLASVLLLIK